MISFQTVILAALFLLMIFSIRPVQDKTFLAKEDTLRLRGLLAAFIIIFHVSKEADPVYPLFEYLSVVAVGSFFFLSGFGSAKSYLHDDGYRKSYLLKRFSGLILPYLIMTGIYWLYYEYTGVHHSFMDVVNGIIGFAPLVTYSWFIVSIIVHYAVFYLLMVLAGSNKKLLFWVYLILLVLDMMLVLNGHRPAWMIEYLFSLGVLCACQEEAVSKTVDDHAWLFLGGGLAMTVLMNVSDLGSGPFFKLLERMLFILMVMAFFCRFSLKGSFLAFLGHCSLEIYMCQGLAKALVRRFYGGPLFIQDLLIYLLCLLLSWLANRAFRRLRGLIKA